jgi:hypothetical protein
MIMEGTGRFVVNENGNIGVFVRREGILGMFASVPRVQVKRRPSASSRTHSDGPVSQTCLHRL